MKLITEKASHNKRATFKMSQDKLESTAMQMSIKTITIAKAIEEKNQNIREQILKNNSILDDLDSSSASAQKLDDQLKEKKKILENKQQELIYIQNAIISKIKTQNLTSKGKQDSESIQAIPIVVNRIQKFINDLTEATIKQQSLSIPITLILKVIESINKLYDSISDADIIKETEEEKLERLRKYQDTQNEIVNKIKEIIQKIKSETNESKQEEETNESKHEEETNESKHEEETNESKHEEETNESKQEENNESKHEENNESKQEENNESKQEENNESKQEENNESKQEENNESKQEEEKE